MRKSARCSGSLGGGRRPRWLHSLGYKIKESLLGSPIRKIVGLLPQGSLAKRLNPSSASSRFEILRSIPRGIRLRSQTSKMPTAVIARFPPQLQLLGKRLPVPETGQAAIRAFQPRAVCRPTTQLRTLEWTFVFPVSRRLRQNELRANPSNP